MGDYIRIETISQLHESIGYEKPKHPLITLIDLTKISPTISTMDLHILTSFYTICLKEGSNCKNKHGRQHYDFQEGSLTFIAPEQELSVYEDDEEVKNSSGWILSFHPDLIYKSTLSNKMQQYTFFQYNSNEALHLSDQEKVKITDVVKDIQMEFSQNIDVFSQDLIISYIELLLNHCRRFYGRQFITRAKVNRDFIEKFEALLGQYFDSDKKETGKNTQEHIHIFLIERAKSLLIGTEKPVSMIAAELGFEYPQHFSKLFKNRTGISPTEYRK